MNESNLPSRISILVLGVSSIQKSAAFYREALGMEVNAPSEALAFVSLSGITLMLSAELGKTAEPLAGATEFVFPVESVTRSHAMLRDRGCHFIRPPREVTPGSWAATFTDPDQHKLTVFGSR